MGPKLPNMGKTPLGKGGGPKTNKPCKASKRPQKPPLKLGVNMPNTGVGGDPLSGAILL